MQPLYACCAGLDVHKTTVVACRISRDDQGKRIEDIRTFNTMTPDLLELSDWLQETGCTHVVMESTSVYWKPIYNILSPNFQTWIVNARHIKAVPGRKTDIKDAAWLAQCLELGLVTPSLVPDPVQQDLRELTRCRANFVRERAALVNRVHKLLEPCNIKLASVATDLMGVSGRAMLKALAEGVTDPEALADLAKGQLRHKRNQLVRALTGQMRPVHRLVLQELLTQIQNLDASLDRIGAAIEEAMPPFEQAVSLLVTIPGVGRTAAQAIIAEIGTDMSKFPSAAHLCAWAGVAPGNNESAGKRKSSKTRLGNRTLRSTLVQSAHAAARTKQTYLSAQYKRLRSRRSDKKAAMAVAHSILVIIYHLLSRNEPYQDLGGDYFDRRNSTAVAKSLVNRLANLGYTVTLEQRSEDTLEQRSEDTLEQRSEEQIQEQQPLAA